jgi:hypothetical protein
MSRCFKDMSQYRENRVDSDIVQNWINNYKNMVLEDIIFRFRQPNIYDERWLSEVREHPECAEIAIDTLIGWLNSPVGRTFIRESFNVPIPDGEDGLSKNW